MLYAKDSRNGSYQVEVKNADQLALDCFNASCKDVHKDSNGEYVYDAVSFTGNMMNIVKRYLQVRP